MSGRDYPRDGIETFGAILLASSDLDPVYVALDALRADPAEGGMWDTGQVKRFLVAYWCLYHCGAAAYLSSLEGQNFWIGLQEAAKNQLPAPTGERWPRGHERRHWRGRAAIESCEHLARLHPAPEAMVDWIMTAAPSYEGVAERVQGHRGFGPWISFKVADMLDRCLGVHVDFSEAAVFMFKDPYAAALRVWREKLTIPDNAHPKSKREEQAIIHRVVEHLSDVFSGYTAPPLDDRPVGLQEVETILCKWKSHMNGHYPYFNDIREIRDGLAPWAEVSTSAAEFLGAMPELPEGER